MFADQFKAFVNISIAHQQFFVIKRDPHEIISRFSHYFHMTYQRMDSPYMVILEVAMHIYQNLIIQLIAIFLRRSPIENINTLEKVFQEVVTFMK